MNKKTLTYLGLAALGFYFFMKNKSTVANPTPLQPPAPPTGPGNTYLPDDEIKIEPSSYKPAVYSDVPVMFAFLTGSQKLAVQQLLGGSAIEIAGKYTTALLHPILKKQIIDALNALKPVTADGAPIIYK